jgi:hypothetical protein
MTRTTGGGILMAALANGGGRCACGFCSRGRQRLGSADDRCRAIACRGDRGCVGRDRVRRRRIFRGRVGARRSLGHAAWGGEHAELSTAQRIGSAVAVIVWAAAILIVLGRAGLWARGPRLALVFRWGTWFLAAVSVLAALVNFASQSRLENFIFGPLALVLALLCTLVARAGSSRDDKPR